MHRLASALCERPSPIRPPSLAATIARHRPSDARLTSLSVSWPPRIWSTSDAPRSDCPAPLQLWLHPGPIGTTQQAAPFPAGRPASGQISTLPPNDWPSWSVAYSSPTARDRDAGPLSGRSRSSCSLRALAGGTSPRETPQDTPLAAPGRHRSQAIRTLADRK